MSPSDLPKALFCVPGFSRLVNTFECKVFSFAYTNVCFIKLLLLFFFLFTQKCSSDGGRGCLGDPRADSCHVKAVLELACWILSPAQFTRVILRRLSSRHASGELMNM